MDRLLELAAGKNDDRLESTLQCTHRAAGGSAASLFNCSWPGGADGSKLGPRYALNGVSFVESSLGLGDCLSLGPVELEVIDPQAPVATEPVKQQPSEESASDSRPSEGRALARARGRKLLATLRQERSTQVDLRQQISDLQAEADEANVERDNHGRKLESVLAELVAAATT